MKRTLFLYIIFCFVTVSTAYAREKVILNDNWYFTLSDNLAYKEKKFDDSEWRVLSLPHDWAFEGPYSLHGQQKAEGGYKSGGIGWYRKTFTISHKEIDKRYFLNFDAVYMNSEVWINGFYLGKRPYGYISFSYEISQYLQEGNNTIAVRVDNSLEPSARWYHGCGIYGNVYLVKTSIAKFIRDGIFIQTLSMTEKEIHASIDCELENVSNDYELRCSLYSPEGKLINNVKVSNTQHMEMALSMEDIRMWNIDSPILYSFKVMLYQNGKLEDEIILPFGFRSIKWEAQTGFWLNGNNLKIKGVCEHLEGGPIGAAWTKEMIRWKIRLLKSMGCNAVRTAHNPQVPDFYDVCDEEGMLVLDEIYDGWGKKAANDYGKQAFETWWKTDIQDWIRRDRNHPSVILYSVGNETSGQMADELVTLCHTEDPSRLVTSGHSGTKFMDIIGMNGLSEQKSFIDSYIPKDKVFIATEAPHTWQVRGFYRTQTWYRDGYYDKIYATTNLTEKEIFTYDWICPDKKKNSKQLYNSSYDNATVRMNIRQSLAILRDSNWYSGSFRWTGFDYLGEAAYVHGGWPFRAFMGGIIDLAGFPKDSYFLYQSQWTTQPMLHLFPHWTHPYMKSGTLIPIWVYTNADEVELFHNGRSLGRKSRGKDWGKMQCDWLVPWEPGEIKAISYKNGRAVHTKSYKTASQPSKLKYKIQNINRDADGSSYSIVTLSSADSTNNIYPYGENSVYFMLEGPAEMKSLENGCPTDTTSNYGVNSRKMFFGYLRAFIQKKEGNAPVSLLTASIMGDKQLKISDKISIDYQQVALRGVLPRRNIEIYYTLDGSIPNKQDFLYTAPFSVARGTKVMAALYVEGKCQMILEETFGGKEGLYWNEDGKTYRKSGEYIDLSTCTLLNGEVVKNSNEEFIRIYNEGTASFYQENDGEERLIEICIECKNVQKREAFVMNKDVNEKQFLSPTNGWKKIIFNAILYKGANNFIIGGIDYIKTIEIRRKHL